MYPFQNLLQKNVPFNWSTSQATAFQEVKKAIVTNPTLSTYDPVKRLVLENDSSEFDFGSTAMQDGKPLGFASRTFASAEKNKAQIERDLLESLSILGNSTNLHMGDLSYL